MIVVNKHLGIMLSNNIWFFHLRVPFGESVFCAFPCNGEYFMEIYKILETIMCHYKKVFEQSNCFSHFIFFFKKITKKPVGL